MKETETPPRWAGVLPRQQGGAASPPLETVTARLSSKARRCKATTALQTLDRAKLPLESHLFPAKT